MAGDPSVGERIHIPCPCHIWSQTCIVLAALVNHFGVGHYWADDAVCFGAYYDCAESGICFLSETCKQVHWH